MADTPSKQDLYDEAAMQDAIAAKVATGSLKVVNPEASPAPVQSDLSGYQPKPFSLPQSKPQPSAEDKAFDELAARNSATSGFASFPKDAPNGGVMHMNDKAKGDIKPADAPIPNPEKNQKPTAVDEAFYVRDALNAGIVGFATFPEDVPNGGVMHTNDKAKPDIRTASDKGKSGFAEKEAARRAAPSSDKGQGR